MSIIQKVQKINTVLWIICPWIFAIGYPIIRYFGIIDFKFDMWIWIGVSALGLACSTFVCHVTAKYED